MLARMPLQYDCQSVAVSRVDAAVFAVGVHSAEGLGAGALEQCTVLCEIKQQEVILECCEQCNAHCTAVNTNMNTLLQCDRNTLRHLVAANSSFVRGRQHTAWHYLANSKTEQQHSLQCGTQRTMPHSTCCFYNSLHLTHSLGRPSQCCRTCHSQHLRHLHID